MSRQYRAPTANGAVLAEPPFDAIPALVEANRRSLDAATVAVGGIPLRDFRAKARREVLGADDTPLLIGGHQPELSHPGVWVKNFALNGLAHRLGGTPLHLVVDNDTLKSATLRFPTFRDRDPHSVRLESLPFDTLSGEIPYEDRAVSDAEQFRSFPDRARPLWVNWGYEPLLPRVWKPAANVGEAFTAMRRDRERAWGCDNRELAVSGLSQTDAFRRFAGHILGDLPRFRDAYNAAIRTYRAANGVRSANHPAPELAEGEAPFWVRSAGGRRARATAASDPATLRPRALTLTLFCRVCLGDLFMHGIGGGKYDEVTDGIIRNYFGIDPPAYQVVSATLHLPLPHFPSSAADLTRAERRLRDLRWNPHAGQASADELLAVAGREPPHADHAARRAWFRDLQRVKERLRARVADQVPEAEAALERVRVEVGANAILQRRDYAWVLYPEEVLRPFLQGFL
jgi:hypothetical protein